jgi:hypothetical protein
MTFSMIWICLSFTVPAYTSNDKLSAIATYTTGAFPENLSTTQIDERVSSGSEVIF